MRRAPRVSILQAGIVGIVLIAGLCYFVFGGSLPWASSPFVLKATFTANTELHIPSPVRIAGVDVGEVISATEIPGSRNAGTITMDLNANALPVHADATATIRSRTFLEGNFYVALQPGSPSSRVLPSGATLPAANTSGPVQLDRILSSLNSPVRADLQTVLRGLGTALDSAAPGGETGAQALNRTLRYSTGAFEASAIVNQALLGSAPHDLSGVVRNTSDIFSALASGPEQLSGLVDHFEQTMSTLAARQSQLAETVAALPGLLRNTISADASLNNSFPSLRTFSTDLVPALHQLDPTTTVALPWLAALTTLVGRPKLGGLLGHLTPAVSNTAAAVAPATDLIKETDNLARCGSGVLVPTGNETISDPPQTSDQKVYEELFQSAVGLASAAGDFDGNGRFLRASTAGGGTLVQTPSVGVNGPLYGNAVLSPLGTRPALPAAAPAVSSSRPCYRNAAPNLNDASTGTGP